MHPESSGYFRARPGREVSWGTQKGTVFLWLSRVISYVFQTKNLKIRTTGNYVLPSLVSNPRPTPRLKPSVKTVSLSIFQDTGRTL